MIQVTFWDLVVTICVAIAVGIWAGIAYAACEEFRKLHRAAREQTERREFLRQVENRLNTKTW